jgi:hypothetical protein
MSRTPSQSTSPSQVVSRKYFCYVIAANTYVNLGFPLGTQLPDPNRRLNGIRRILTFNTDDFAPYDVEAIHPLSLSP